MAAFTDMVTRLLGDLRARMGAPDAVVDINRGTPLPASAVLGVWVRMPRSNGVDATLDGSLLQWTTSIEVICAARTSAGVTAEARITSAIADVFTSIAAAAAPGESWSANVSIDWQSDALETSLSNATVMVRVDHFTTKLLEAPPEPT